MTTKPPTPTRILTNHGYSILKSALKADQEAMIRKELTVKPNTVERFSGPKDEPFPVYLESAARLYLPRIWARDHIGLEEDSVVGEGVPLREDLVFTGKPFDYQEAIIAKFLTAGANGLICVPCGRGKTFMALAIAYRLKKRFMVVVDKEFLLDQWAGEMRSLIPGIRIGRFQADKMQVDPNEYDCTICMIQTVVQREVPVNVIRSYGFTIFDECHHLGAKHFSKVLSKIQTKNMLGLSATPTRDDGLTKVFEWHLGKPVYWEKRREADETVRVEIMRFEDPNDAAYNDVPTNFRGETILARLLTQVLACKKRNDMIAERLKELVAEPGRRVLVLSERIGHLEDLEERMKVLVPGVKMGYYIGGMKTEVRENAAKDAQILWASYAMASEAMNIKTLNCVLMASPRKKIEQSTGRILRQRPEERALAPLIIDVVDSHGSYMRQSRERIAYYKKCGYKIVDVLDGSDSDEDGAAILKATRQSKKKVDESVCLLVDDD